MSEDLVKHDVLLKNNVLGEGYFATSPSHVLLPLTEKSIQLLRATREAYELAAGHLPKEEFVYGLEVAFRSFDYMVENEEAEPDESGELPLEQWNDNWEIAKVRVNQDGFRFKAIIKHVDIEMESEMFTFAQFEDEIRKFRSLQMAAGIESAMQGEDAPAPRKSSGPSVI